MSDPNFEMRLHRMFSETPAYADAPLFAVDVENRLGRGWALRRVLIGAAGVVGGLVATLQIAGGGVAARFMGAIHLFDDVRRSFAQAPASLPPPFSEIGQLPFGGEVIWLVVGMAVLAAALLASRSLEEI